MAECGKCYGALVCIGVFHMFKVSAVIYNRMNFGGGVRDAPARQTVFGRRDGQLCPCDSVIARCGPVMWNCRVPVFELDEHDTNFGLGTHQHHF